MVQSGGGRGGEREKKKCFSFLSVPPSRVCHEPFDRCIVIIFAFCQRLSARFWSEPHFRQPRYCRFIAAPFRSSRRRTRTLRFPLCCCNWWCRIHLCPEFRCTFKFTLVRFELRGHLTILWIIRVRTGKESLQGEQRCAQGQGGTPVQEEGGGGRKMGAK